MLLIHAHILIFSSLEFSGDSIISYSFHSSLFLINMAPSQTNSIYYPNNLSLMCSLKVIRLLKKIIVTFYQYFQKIKTYSII